MDLMRRRGIMLSVPYLQRVFGSIASFETNYPYKLEKMLINIEPIQDLHGHSTPFPAGGGKNRLNSATNVRGSYISSSGGIAESSDAQYTDLIPVSEGCTYTWSLISGRSITTGTNRWHGYSADGTWVQQVASKTAPKASGSFTLTASIPSGVAFVRLSYGSADTNVQFEFGSTPTAYEPYSESNICPINGRTGCSIAHTEGVLADSDTAPTLAKYIYVAANQWKASSDSRSYYMPCQPNATYVISCKNPDITIFRACYITTEADSSTVTAYSIVNQDHDGVLTLTTGNDAKYVVVQINKSLIDANVTQFRIGKGNAYNVLLSAIAGTIYGGILDVVEKKLTVDFASRTLPNADSIRDSALEGTGKFVRYSLPKNASVEDDVVNVLGEKLKGINCSSTEYRAAWMMQTYTGDTNNYLAVFVPAEYTLEQIDTAIAGSQIIYKLATPIVYDLSDVPEIITFLGQNNIWADAGDVDVTFYKI